MFNFLCTDGHFADRCLVKDKAGFPELTVLIIAKDTREKLFF
jgi:hypothetical protein